MEVPKSVYTGSRNWLLNKIQHFQKGLGSKLVPVKHYEASACTHVITKTYTQTEQVTNLSLQPGK
jgi:hypothetical protein